MRERHMVGTSLPTSVTAPSPVMTTRRLGRLLMCGPPRQQSETRARWRAAPVEAAGWCEGSGRSRQSPHTTPSRAGSLLDVIDGLADSLNLLGFLIGNGGFELVFEFHDQLDGVETVGIQIVGEAGFARDLGFIDAHLLGNDVDDFGFDLGFGHGVFSYSNTMWGTMP